MLAAFVLATVFAPSLQGEPVPYEALGNALIAAADARRIGEAPRGNAEPELVFLRRMEPLHQRIRLGAIEIWVPSVTVRCDLSLGPAMSLGDAAPIAEAAVKLQRQWVELAGLDGGDEARAKKAFTRLDAWAHSLGGSRVAEIGPELAADNAWLAARFRRDPANPSAKQREYGMVLFLAPERPQYLAILGAGGIVDERYRIWFWDESGRRSAGTPLFPSSCLVPFAYGPDANDGPHCENHPLARDERLQLALHTLSHLVARNLAPAIPSWFGEGLALFDTIRATGADETLCTGVRDFTTTLTSLPGGLPTLGPAGMLRWVQRDASPFRDGSSPRFFLKELAAAQDPKRGFGILDFGTGLVAQYERGPFLGSRAVVPDSIATAPDGVKHGYAEFFRAYCGAFVDYLFEQRLDKQRLLRVALVELRKRSPDANAGAPDDLLDVLERAMKTAADATPGSDSVERAFDEWLSRRR
ncbi:MAG: hypothetical protein K8S98_05330 [Planctomycetes bacterium]|nr:hypothetical protein [Planctomycetota bacterium]